MMSSSQFLPTTVKEMQALGWERPDVVLFTGDAYVDHPSFGAAVIGRVLEARGYKVAIVPQPNWQDDLRDFKKFGAPRLFFGVTAGAMDSMVNHYTAARRRRSDDAYTPDARHGARPDYPTIVYTQILRQLYPDVPIIAGGIEASMRRLSHYDYWQDQLRPSILVDSKADMVVYGMGEKPLIEIADALNQGAKIGDLTQVRQTVVMEPIEKMPEASDKNIILHSFEQCQKDKKCQAENFKHIETQSNLWNGSYLWQPMGQKVVKVNPMNPPLTTQEIDSFYDLPYTRQPHPRYKGKRIPAYEMIRHSVTMHRGCFGGCAFCTISAHQGKFIASRSPRSILREVKAITKMPDYKGYLSDLGGPSANMYQMGGKNLDACRKCRRPSCLHPLPCPNLNADHGPLLNLYKQVSDIPEVKKAMVGSGVRYDLSIHDKKNGLRYNRELIENHVSGRLKVAPEHTSPEVLKLMRKPSFELYHQFSDIFTKVNKECGLRQQLIPYFISSHPGCREQDMAELAAETKQMGLRLEQVQDFTPTPMTLATEIYYTGINPYTGEKVFTANTPKLKEAQRQFFFWYDPERKRQIIQSLKTMGRLDLAAKLYPTHKYDPRKQR